MTDEPDNAVAIELTSAQRKALHGALQSAFPAKAALAKMVDFELGQNLETITSGGPLNDVVYELIVWSQAHGKLGALVSAARRDNPDNPKLRQFEESIVQARNARPEDPNLRQLADQVNLAPGPAASAPVIERIVNRSSQLHDPSEWRQRQSRSELAVCLLEVAGADNKKRPFSTAFLVGPDLVMTAYYAIEPFLEEQGRCVLRFDYREYGDGKVLSQGQEYQLASDWLVDSSPVQDLDYALLRVAGRPGDDPVAGQAGAPARGWITPQAQTFRTDELLFIVQHVEGGPLKLASGPFLGVTTRGAWKGTQLPMPGPTKPWTQERIVYGVFTRPGSGGAPVFASDWTLVALHEGAVSVEDPTEKRGISMSLILDALRTKGIDLPVAQQSSPRVELE